METKKNESNADNFIKRGFFMKKHRILFVLLVVFFTVFYLSSSFAKEAVDVGIAPAATTSIPHDISANSISKDIIRFYTWGTGSVVALEGEVLNVSSHVLYLTTPICRALVKLSASKYVEIGVNGSENKLKNDIAISTCNTITQAIGNKIRVKGTVSREVTDLRARYFISVQDLNYVGSGRNFEISEERENLPSGWWRFDGRVRKIYHSTIEEGQFCAVDLDQARCPKCGGIWSTEDHLVHVIVFPNSPKCDPIRGDITSNQVTNHYLGMCQNLVSALNSGDAVHFQGVLGLFESPDYYPKFLYPDSFRLYNYTPR